MGGAGGLAVVVGLLSGGAVCKDHAQNPAFAPDSSEVANGF